MPGAAKLKAIDRTDGADEGTPLFDGVFRAMQRELCDYRRLLVLRYGIASKQERF